ncbi:hypothetical protein UVI_02060590 [Ustilaginoidea virens]|uniref:Uncharacterized protein n=1 Tax=Ustilaginoidea virens TaxID=1159556 RepID=A0A1B5L673_USTVR|nr:hypothetical protein UVI_02060590 [Ustilaginoidea virens]
MASITILYPTGPAFDLESWKQLGLRGWEVVQFVEGPYQIQCILRFDSLAAWEAASTGPVFENLVADIPRFTAAQPLIISGESRASDKF